MDNEYDILLQRIRDRITSNANNEITGAILEPILEDLLNYSKIKIGDLNDLNTQDTSNIVSAINSVLEVVEQNLGVKVYTGVEDPNINPPVEAYNIGDMYSRLDGENNPLELYIYTGVNWVNLTSGTDVINQDNIAIAKRYTSNVFLNNAQVAELVNEGSNFTITDTQELYILVSQGVNSPTVSKYKVFNKGKGTYGRNGAIDLVAADIELLTSYTATTGDIEDDPTTDRFYFGDLTTQSVSQWLNTQNPPIEIQPQDEGYVIFYGTVNSEDTSYLWVGTAGTYGLADSQSTDADFQLLNEVNPVVDAIPRAGTEVGRPLTGDIEVNSDNQAKTGLIQKDGTYIKRIGFSDDYVPAIENESAEGVNRLEVNPINVIIDNSLPESKGIIGTAEFINDGLDRKQFVQTGFLLDNLGTSPIEPDFYIACTYESTSTIRGRYLTYETDTFRKFDLAPHVPNYVDGLIFSTNGIEIVDDRTIIMSGQLSNSQGNLFLLVLRGCGTLNNEFKVESSEFREMTDILRNSSNEPSKIQFTSLSRGYLYFVTRSVTSTVPTQVGKINPYNFNDYKIVSLPLTSDFIGSVQSAKMFEGSMYFLSTTVNYSTEPQKFIRVSENLDSQEVLFYTNNPGSTERVPLNNPFAIYDDKVFIPTVRNSTLGQSKIGMSVYSLAKKVFIFSVAEQPINALNVGSNTFAYPHWMSIFGGKIFIHTASGGANQSRSLVRIDTTTLLVEASTPLPYRTTDDNTITKDGFIYLNPEIQSDAYLIKIRTNFVDNENFTTINEGAATLGYYSLGSPSNNYDGTLYKTKLSQFLNDLSTNSTPTLQQVTSQGATTTVTTVTRDSVTPDIKTTIAPNSVKTEVPDGRYTEQTHDGITFKNTTVNNFKLNLKANTQTSDHIVNFRDRGGDVAFLDEITGGGGGTAYTATAPIAISGNVISLNETGFVHIAGAETITGKKTFTDEALVSNLTPRAGSTYRLGTNTAPYLALVSSFGSFNNIRAIGNTDLVFTNGAGNTTLATLINATGKMSFVNSPTVPTPTATTDAANKGYVDSIKLSSVLSISANRTLTIADFVNNGELDVFVDATAGIVTVTLPTSALMLGYKINLIKTDNSANSVIVKGAGTTNINQANTYPLTVQNQSVTIKSNNSQYWIF